MGPLIVFNLEQTGVVGTICLCPYQCSPLWSYLSGFMLHINTQLQFPRLAACCGLWTQAFATSQRAGHSGHLYSGRINDSCPFCVYFRWLQEHETGQPKHRCVFILVYFMGYYIMHEVAGRKHLDFTFRSELCGVCSFSLNFLCTIGAFISLLHLENTIKHRKF